VTDYLTAFLALREFRDLPEAKLRGYRPQLDLQEPRFLRQLNPPIPQVLVFLPCQRSLKVTESNYIRISQ